MINYEELSERKLKILHAVIQNYLETGEPVGSRTISKYTDLNLSSATIRNEMADFCNNIPTMSVDVSTFSLVFPEKMCCIKTGFCL